MTGKERRPTIDGGGGVVLQVNIDQDEDNKHDTSISDLVGPFGRWQRNIALFYFVVYILSTFNNLGITFHNAKTDYVCVDGHGNNISDNTFVDQCGEVECRRWQFNNSIGFRQTITSEFELTCWQEWLSSLSQSVYQLGYVFSGLAIGFLSDTYGRRLALLVSISAELLGGFLVIFSPTIYVYILARGLLGFGDSGRGMCLYMLIIETVGAHHRTDVVIGTSFGWVVGYLLMPLVAYFAGSFRILQAFSTLSMLAIAIFWLRSLDESPRWLLTKQRHDKAHQILRQAAERNDRLDDRFEEKFEQLKLTLDKDQSGKDSLGKHNSEKMKKYSLLQLLINRKYAPVVLALWVVFFAAGFIYHGFSLNVDLLAGDVYLNVALAGLIEVPSMVGNLVGMRYVGRRFFTLTTFGLAGVAYLLAAFGPMLWWSPDNSSTSVLALTMLAKMFIFSAYNAIYIHAGELFPTPLRQLGVGSCSIAARAGSIVAPFVREFTLYYNLTITLCLFGGLALVVALLAAALLPETKDKELQDQVR